MPPARLHHPQPRLAEKLWHQAAQKIWRRHKIGVKQSDKFARGRRQPCRERPRLIANPVRTEIIFYAPSLAAMIGHPRLGESGRVIR